MKVWLYARVSTAKNRCRTCEKKFMSAEDQPACPQCAGTDIEKSQDTQNQLRIMRTWMVQSGNEVTAEYIDRKSGKTEDRIQFKQMFVDLENRKPRVPILIAFWALDRLSREGVLETLQYLQRFTKLGAEWKSYTEQFLDSTGIFREAIISIFATLAKQQRVRIAENTRAGLARAQVDGTRSGKAIGRPPEIDLTLAQAIYDKTKSYRATGVALGVSGNAVKYALDGRPKPKEQPKVWSPPMWGTIERGDWVERADGPIVVRCDQATGIPYCINHQMPIKGCIGQHVEEMNAEK